MEGDLIGKLAVFFGIAIAIGLGFQILGTYAGSVDESTIGSSSTINLTPNSDVVVNSGYPDFLPGDSAFGTGTTQEQRHFFNFDNQAKIRQSGTSTQLTFELADGSDSSSFNSFYVSIWRPNATGDGWTQVDTTGNILSKVQALPVDTTQTITLSPSEYLTHQEGDYINFGWTNDVDASNPAIIETILDPGATSSYFFDDTPIPSTTDLDWTSGTTANDNWAIIKLRAQAPSIAFIGDSITAGHTGHFSYIEETSTSDDHTASYPYKVGSSLGVTIQNMGEGSPDNLSADGLARFTEDVVDLKPKIVVIGYGTADINNSVSLSTFSSNMQAMITEAQSAGITPILQEVYPRDFDTDTKDANRLLFNSEIRSLAESNGIVSVSNEDIGDGGTPNALDAAYDSGDGIHPNEAGYTEIAENTVAAINSIPTSSWGEIYQNYESQAQGGMALLSLIMIVFAAVVIITVIRMF